MNHPINITVPVLLTPEQIAEFWCELDSHDQARFFNEVARRSADWGAPFPFQVQAIIDSKELTIEGRSVMQDFGDYGYSLGVD